jgi:hypothetical protein
MSQTLANLVYIKVALKSLNNTSHLITKLAKKNFMIADPTSPSSPASPMPHWSSHFSTPGEEGMPVPKYSFGALPSLTQATLRNRMNFELLVWEHFYSYDTEKKTFASKGNGLGLSRRRTCHLSLLWPSAATPRALPLQRTPTSQTSSPT